MILGHIIPTSSIVRKVIFSFHMPLFIIISGYFFKEEKILDLTKKTLISLFIPYIIALLVGNVIQGFLKQSTVLDTLVMTMKQFIYSISFQKNIDFGTKSVGPIWFIPFLIVCKYTFWGICKITKNNDVIKGIICYSISIIGIYIGKKGYWLPFSIDVAFACMLFMYFGYILKKFNILDTIVRNWKILPILIIAWLISLHYGNIELAIRSYPNILTSYIVAIFGTIVIMMISYYIEMKSKYISKMLMWFGKNSIYILCMHRIESITFNYGNIGMLLKFVLKMTIATTGTALINLIKKLNNKMENIGNKY